ncbi:MAG: hypothetical protein M3N27_02270, partial [Thermoproteota archaeon]|nr:hypothetical protein [Thermoproteota archaeon]
IKCVLLEFILTIDQTLQQEINDSKVWISREKEESIYKRDLKKRIELIKWALENMKNPTQTNLPKSHRHGKLIYILMCFKGLLASLNIFCRFVLVRAYLKRTI